MYREQIKSRIRTDVKKTLREFDYPEDKTEVAINSVWNQLELLENEIKIA
jgi:hypothetical protein